MNISLIGKPDEAEGEKKEEAEGEGGKKEEAEGEGEEKKEEGDGEGAFFFDEYLLYTLLK